MWLSDSVVWSVRFTLPKNNFLSYYISMHLFYNVHTFTLLLAINCFKWDKNLKKILFKWTEKKRAKFHIINVQLNWSSTNLEFLGSTDFLNWWKSTILPFKSLLIAIIFRAVVNQMDAVKPILQIPTKHIQLWFIDWPFKARLLS